MTLPCGNCDGAYQKGHPFDTQFGELRGGVGFGIIYAMQSIYADKRSVLLFCAFIAALAAVPSAAKEKAYDFRKRLAVVHEEGRREASLKPSADEVELSDGMFIVVPDGTRGLLFRAAQDFQDYLAVSMGVSAAIREKGRLPGKVLSVEVAIKEDLAPATSEFVTGPGGVLIAASDERAAMQALFHLEDLMNLRCAPFLKKGKERRRQLFSPRMTHSGWGLDVFPDAYLRKIAHAGMDAIVVFIKDIDRTAGASYQDVNDVIRRAKSFGLDTYLYSYIKAFAHPDDPGAGDIFDSTYGRVAGNYPEARGIVFVGESCEFPTKDERALPLSHRQPKPKGDSRPYAGWFPCRDYPAWLRAVKSAIDRHSPGMEIVFWTYNWGCRPEETRRELVRALPKDVALQATFEMFEPQVKRNGLNAPSADYSLSFAGPGRYFASEADEAHKLGLKLYTMANAGGLTWDFGTVPYQPCPYQWNARYRAMRKANAEWGLCGVMECHHYGWWPSFISEIEKEALTEGGMEFEAHLRAIAARDFGGRNVDAACAAWRKWSDAARDYVASDENQYGPFRIGPAYPYNIGGDAIKRDEFPCAPYAHFGIRICRLNYLAASAYGDIRWKRFDAERHERELPLLEDMAAAWSAGAAAFEGIAGRETGRRAAKARDMARLGRYFWRTVLTAINVKRGHLAAEKNDMDGVRRWARAEYANARAALELVEADSRLGWEPSMEYAGGPEQIRWKLGRMEKLYGDIFTGL